MGLAPVFWFVLGCGPTDLCEEMCDVAMDRYVVCLAEFDLTWGPYSGYSSEGDYRNWCETWSWEQRQLDETQVCADNIDVFQNGDCDAYFAAWAS